MKENEMSSRVRTGKSSVQATPIERRALLLSGLALPLGMAAARHPSASALRSSQTSQTAQTAQTARLTLPPPAGRYRLGTVSLHLIDKSRPDPWVPAIPFRALMIQIWYPARPLDGYPRAPYFTPVLARAYEKLQGIPVALNWPVTDAQAGAPVRQRAGGWPVLLFSPGLEGERSDTTCLVEELASRGYVVVTIDHIHDSGVVELPSGQLATIAVPPPPPGNSPQTIKEINSRVADVRFILDQLAVISHGGNPDHAGRPLPAGLHRALDLGRVGMFGHSDGGSATAHAMHADARIKAGVNLDGTFWTPQAVAGSGRPLLLFGKQDLDSLQASTWAEFWKNQRGPKRWLNLAGSVHATFTDFAPLVPQVAPILGKPHSWVIQGIGTINGDRAVAVERAYLDAWFDTYLRHRGSPLLTGPSPRYPEVRFTRLPRKGGSLRQPQCSASPQPLVAGPLPAQQQPRGGVELAGVTKTYGRGTRAVVALDGVSAVFPPGSFSAVMGMSGSGKSTLLQVAAGLDRPTAGAVCLGGTDLSRLSGRGLSVLRRRQVGFVFQDLNLVPSLSVAENIALPLRLDRQPVDKDRIGELARLVGIGGQLRRLPHTLSGGQQQRAAIARALVTRPAVIFADEPTASLDLYTGEAITALLRRAVDELGQTVVVVTHDPAVAARADRALILDQGRLTEVVSGCGAADLAIILRRLGTRTAR
jgi:ABC-type lipoprotein export system ATPase subunit/predicted dienelactone hydrolase